MYLKRRAAIHFVLGMLASSVLAASAEAGVLYTQPPDIGPAGYTTMLSAYTDSSLGYYRALDNFQVSSDATIGSITWQGMYLNYDPSTGYTAGLPNTRDWVISLYTAGGPSDFPFTLVATETVAASDVTETLAGTTSIGSPSRNYYDESTTLSPGFAIQGGQTYYLSIFSDNGGSKDSWSWLSGSGGDSSSWWYSTYSDSTDRVPFDRTFTLYSAAVPEPSGLLLGLMGVLGSVASVRMIDGRKRCTRPVSRVEPGRP